MFYKDYKGVVGILKCTDWK